MSEPPKFGKREPFDTVPRDGTVVMITCGGPCWPAVVVWDEEKKAWRNGDGHFDSEDNWPLSHWMPLPEPPTS